VGCSNKTLVLFEGWFGGLDVWWFGGLRPWLAVFVIFLGIETPAPGIAFA